MTCTLQILLFGAAREISGCSTISLPLQLPCTSASLKKQLSIKYPELSPLILSSRLAVNQAYVQDGDEVEESDEVALIPPVSGG